ncbi:MAG: hemerythrin family protein [Polyangiaceae bacterium]
MNRFVLEGELLTGVSSIDDQHRHLFELAGLATSSRFEHFGHDWFRETVNTLVDYTHYHFSAEEHLMRRIQYPGFEAHRTWHDQFRLELSEFVDLARRKQETGDLRAVLSEKVDAWLLEHIRTMDCEFAAFALGQAPVDELDLVDSCTLRRAGVLVAEIEGEMAVSTRNIT